jgi:hypothetical protein
MADSVTIQLQISMLDHKIEKLQTTKDYLMSILGNKEEQERFLKEREEIRSGR